MKVAVVNYFGENSVESDLKKHHEIVPLGGDPDVIVIIPRYGVYDESKYQVKTRVKFPDVPIYIADHTVDFYYYEVSERNGDVFDVSGSDEYYADELEGEGGSEIQALASKFKSYLIDKSVYVQFLNDLKYRRGGPPFEDLYDLARFLINKDGNGRCMVTTAFTWEDSSRGGDFWNEINTGWEKELCMSTVKKTTIKKEDDLWNL